jgi:signal transduction histidine kinase
MFIETFKKLDKIQINLIGCGLLIIVAFIDYLLNKEISVSIFYLIPVSFTAFYGGFLNGIIFALISSVVWLFMERMDLSQYSNFAIPYWNGFARFLFFSVFVILITKLKKLQDNLQEKVNERTEELEKQYQENIKAHEEILKQSALLSELNKRIELIKEEQNTKIAREIHDELGQALTAVNLELSWLSKKYSSNKDLVARIKNLSELVKDTIETVRKISADLRPKLLDQLGLIPAIEKLIKDISINSKIKIVHEMPSDLNVNNEIFSNTVYRILQEALTNIIRHSNCNCAEVKIEINDDNTFVMNIKDNGKGFDFNKVLNNGKYLGIMGMKERAKIIGGKIAIKSNPNNGTVINLIAPLIN